MSFQTVSFAKLDEFRLEGDDSFDRMVGNLLEDKKNQEVLRKLIAIRGIANSDLEGYLVQNGLEIFLPYINQNTRIVDEALAIAGSVFFEKNKESIYLLLGILSLPYCYAAAKGAEVLAYSKRIIEEPERRLRDTGIFVESVCTKGAFGKSGSGELACLQTRLIHSFARHGITKKYDYQHEKPINQEDMSGTFLSFSLVVVRGLKQIGVKVSDKEADSFLNLWAKISYKIGVKEELLVTNLRDSSYLEEKIRIRQFAYSTYGQQLADSLYAYLAKVSGESGYPPDLIKRLSLYLLGRKVAGCIGVDDVKTSVLDKWMFSRFDWVRKVFFTS